MQSISDQAFPLNHLENPPNTVSGLVPVFKRVHPSTVPPANPDLRNRNEPSYHEFFAKLVADVKVRGVQVPLVTWPGGLGDGETRRRAALLAGSESVPVLEYPEKPPENEVELGMLLANTMRLDMNTMEKITAYAGLLTRNGWTSAELARRIHVSPAQIAKDMGINKNLCQGAKDLVASGELAPRAAYQISRLPDEAVQMDLADKVKRGLLSVEGCEGHVAKLLGSRQKKAKPVKARTLKGLQAIFPSLDFETILAELSSLVEGVRKLQKHSLPLSALPNILKSPS